MDAHIQIVAGFSARKLRLLKPLSQLRLVELEHTVINSTKHSTTLFPFEPAKCLAEPLQAVTGRSSSIVGSFQMSSGYDSTRQGIDACLELYPMHQIEVLKFVRRRARYLEKWRQKS